jgi:hypothetical protein
MPDQPHAETELGLVDFVVSESPRKNGHGLRFRAGETQESVSASDARSGKQRPGQDDRIDRIAGAQPASQQSTTSDC